MSLFRDYDIKFSRYRGSALSTIEKTGGSVAREDINNITKWDESLCAYVVYAQSDVQQAVYYAADAEEWQKFRVSLKGLSTQEKLFCLAYLWDSCGDKKDIMRVRICNYLGALIRGGQLNDKLEIQR